MISLLLLLLTIFVSLIEIFTMKAIKDKKKIIEIFFLNSLLFLFGFNGLIGFFGHIFFGPQIAHLIGWPPGNPFQFEVGIANLAMGSLGILSLFFRNNFLLATVTANTIWFWGDAVGHIRSMIISQDFAPGNAGGYFYADIFFPVIAIILFTFYRKTTRLL
jgi:Family of unknown function (DUF6790)